MGSGLPARQATRTPEQLAGPVLTMILAMNGDKRSVCAILWFPTSHLPLLASDADATASDLSAPLAGA